MIGLFLLCAAILANGFQVSLVSPPTTIPASGTFSVQISYTDTAASGATDIVVCDVLQNSGSYTWFGKGTANINSGSSGTATLTVTLSTAIPAGTANLVLKPSIFPPGYNSAPSTTAAYYSGTLINVVTGSTAATTKSAATTAKPGTPTPASTTKAGPTPTPAKSNPTTSKAPTPTPTPSPAQSGSHTYPRFKGVSLSGAEFGSNTNGGMVPGGSNGAQYVVPTTSDVDYFQSKGFNLFRIPVSWERLQTSLNATLDSTFTGYIDTLLGYITNTKGLYAILDVHNYARYNQNNPGTSNYIGASGGSVTYGNFYNLWQQLAKKWGTNSKIIFGLMNEPHDMATETWFTAAQTGINAIRSTGTTNLITICGNGYSGGYSWTSGSYGTANGNVLTGITDSAKNFVFEVHQYLDSDNSGTHAQCVSQTIGRTQLANFYSWCKSHGYKAILGEFGGQDPTTCQPAVTDLFNYLTSSNDVFVGWVWWVAGQAYITYGLQSSTLYLIENGGANAGTIMSWISPYLSASSTWSQETVSSPQNEFMQKYIYVVVGVIVIGILLILLAVVLRHRRKRGHSYAPERESITLDPSPQKTEAPVLTQTSSAMEIPTDDVAPLTNTEVPPTNSEWKVQTDLNSGAPIYYNTSTGATQWEVPDEVTNPTNTNNDIVSNDVVTNTDVTTESTDVGSV